MFDLLTQLIYDTDAVKQLADGPVALIAVGLGLLLLFVFFMLRQLWKLASFVFFTVWFCGWGMACLLAFFCAGSDSNHCPQPWFQLTRFPFVLLERILGGYGGFGGLGV
ncbi:hypothetical protein PG996_002104 [Apiospora saccharicola]|uniref:Uncharacterized protein n=1 Tax=Apiospora saccharicola TaxID=335842 RepID=A0ABR1WII3_9PEZI